MAAQLSFGILGVGGNPLMTAWGAARIVQVANGDWYAFAVLNPTVSSVTVSWSKSTDKGRTWGLLSPSIGASGTKLSVWYDRWTPGDTGNLIHILLMNQTADDVLYLSLDTSSDSLSGTTTVVNGATFTGDGEGAIVKTKAGNLYIAYDGDGGTETGHYVAASPFTSWTSKSNPNEGAIDWYFALPGNYADTDDYDLYFHDRSADEWSRKTYDASGNSWSESVLVAGAGFVDTATVFPQHAGAIRVSDGMQFAFGWNNYDVAGADLVGFKFDGTTSTGLTDVVTNADDCAGVAALYDEAADRLYVFYLGKSDGSETITATVGVYYKYSDDEGSTWSAEQTLFNSYLDDFRWIAAPPTVASLNVAPPVIWLNDDTTQILTTAENPDTGGGGGGTSGGWWGS